MALFVTCSGCLALGAGVKTNRTLALVVCESAPQEIAARVRRHVEQNLGIKVRVAAPAAKPIDDMDLAAQAYGAHFQPSDICLLGLVQPTTVTNLRGRVYPMQRVALINVPALVAMPSALGGITDEEHIARRFEKEAMRAFGLLIGMKPCPNLRCAMKTPFNDVEIDRKGRNFCPPCYGRSAHILGALTASQFSNFDDLPPPGK